ncbi:hypothetical protein RU86_GL000449 [Lactococcus piscium]|uniref:Uncharacterized protein n=1 Tax=Pseudolactococcus piscium TaxID=1364 RepID=A0A2A5RY91_9LACT|nr:hypothetical protein [Lactococcus piscium]PCS06217.1 hypothetical protein RU86_GL000449 [Lactococcus piscium]
MNRVITLIAKLSIKQIYLLQKIVYGIFIVMIIVPLVLYITSPSSLMLLIYVCFLVTSILFIFYYNLIKNRALSYIFYQEKDLNKWLGFYKYILEKKKKESAKTLYYYALLKFSYFRGEFEKTISIGEKINTKYFDRSQSLLFEIRLYIYKSSLMLRDAELIEKSYSRLTSHKNINKKQLEQYRNKIKYCNLIGNIVNDKQYNDEINSYRPSISMNLLLLEHTYFQALNEQLKGNTDQAKAYFEAISKESSDLFFVRESKQYLEDHK